MTDTQPAVEYESVRLSRQLDALYAAYRSGAFGDFLVDPAVRARWEEDSAPLVEQLHAAAAAEYEAAAAEGGVRAVATPIVVAGELIESAWGNQVRADLLALDSGKVAKTGDTMSGNLTAAFLFVSNAQSSVGSSVARKDYVDAADSARILRGGDTMGGDLLVRGDPATAQGIRLRLDGALIASLTGAGGAVPGTANLSLGRGGGASAAGGQYVQFRQNSSSSADPQGIQTGGIAQVNTTTIAYNTTSDARWKGDVADVDPAEALDRIRRWRPVSFRWKLDAEGNPTESGTPTGERRIGFLAQELAEVEPDAVTPGQGTEAERAAWVARRGEFLDRAAAAVEAGEEFVETFDEPDPFIPWAADNSSLVPALAAAVQALAGRVAELEAAAA